MENDENKEMQEQKVETEPQEVVEEQEEQEQEQPSANFTQEQVNEIVRNRLEKAKNTIYNRYGVADKEELDALVGKAQSYDVMNEQYETMTNDNLALKQENAFLKNNIEPTRYEDIKAYFKGKGVELNADTLKGELEAHKEWIKADESKDITTIEALSSEEPNKHEKSDRERVLNLFGY